jgi:hypothetical protein
MFTKKKIRKRGGREGMKKSYNSCYFASCINPAKYGFKSKNGNIQSEHYCRIHAYQIKNAFPKCKLVKLINIIELQSPNILDCMNLVSEEKQKEVFSELLTDRKVR